MAIKEQPTLVIMAAGMGSRYGGLKQVDRRLELAYSGRYKWIKGVSEDKTTYTSEIVISSK